MPTSADSARNTGMFAAELSVTPEILDDDILPYTQQAATVSAGAPDRAPQAVPSQRDRRSTSRRRGQRPRCRVVGEKYVGRYRIDVPGSTKQVKKAVIIGSIHEMTKPEADVKLLELIQREGVNTAKHLERSRRPAITFGDAARSWRDNHLSVNKKPASKKSTESELRNHVLPYVDRMPFLTVTAIAGASTARWRCKNSFH
jgi:hypothetical protein